MNIELISRSELAKQLGVSIRTLDRVETLPKGFPKKVRITTRRVGYMVKDVNAWVNPLGLDKEGDFS